MGVLVIRTVLGWLLAIVILIAWSSGASAAAAFAVNAGAVLGTTTAAVVKGVNAFITGVDVNKTTNPAPKPTPTPKKKPA